MSSLIIYAGAHNNGHSGSFLEEAKKELEKRNEPYKVIELYSENYDPILHSNELYTEGGYDVSPENSKYQEMIKEAKSLIFIYPIWWQNMPAILKGFLDRVLKKGFAFEYVGKYPKGLLTGKKAAVFTSSGGPRIYNILFARDRGINVLTKNTLAFCGIKSKSFAIGNATKFNEKQQDEIIRLVAKGISYILKE